jgi:purine-nucleoside phosphorylase
MHLSGPFLELVNACRRAPPAVHLVLGSGLNEVAARVQAEVRVPFVEVPGMQAVSVPGHSGCFTLGRWGRRKVLLQEGRLHFYEGHPWETVLRPAALARELGARVALHTNAAGGIGPEMTAGTLAVVRGLQDWTSPDSWKHFARGNGQSAGLLSDRLLRLLRRVAGERGIPLPQGTYAQVVGPNYETRAEVLALQRCGADLVGMSTVREIEAAAKAGMECAALSLVANRAAGLGSGPLSHEEVLRNTAMQVPHLLALLEGFFSGRMKDEG